MPPEEIKVLTETVKILTEMAKSKSNEWLPVYAALGGAIAGAVASFLPTLFMEKRRESKLSTQIESCLLSEISALMEIMEHREYLRSVQQVIQYLNSQPPGATYSYTVMVPPYYSRVYQENCKNIGVVRNEIAHKIVVFHQLVDAIVQDIQPGGIISDGSTIDAFQEMEKIMKRAVEVGSELMNAYNK